ncbi:hypothetical protein INR49_000100 [Caranx melampygus]|nr:hypothetical protein INR49_000100 [Caranx melampygus]
MSSSAQRSQKGAEAEVKAALRVLPLSRSQERPGSQRQQGPDADRLKRTSPQLVVSPDHRRTGITSSQ